MIENQLNMVLGNAHHAIEHGTSPMTVRSIVASAFSLADIA
jgi:hypothetical protein